MVHTKTKYKKWDIVWVYWIFENYIKEETENLESELDTYKYIMKGLRKTAKNLQEEVTKNFLVTKKIEQSDGSVKFYFKRKDFKKMMLLYFQETCFPYNINPLIDWSEHLEQVIYDYLNKIFKGSTKKSRPCLIFHKSNDDFWVMPLSTTNLTNYNEKFDVKLDDKSHIKCCSLQKVHISLIDRKMEIDKGTKLTDVNLQTKIIEKFTWFFLQK